MQIKTTLRYHLTLVRKAVIKETSVAKDVEKRETLCTPHWITEKLCVLFIGLHTGAATMENSIKIPQIELSHGPVILLLGIHPKKTKTLV